MFYNYILNYLMTYKNTEIKFVYNLERKLMTMQKINK